MVRWYDARTEEEFSAVAELLRSNGIEFFVSPDQLPTGPREIRVAEEDIPFADRLLRESGEGLRH